MGGGVSKQLMMISGKSVLEYSIEAFSRSDNVREIILSAKSDEIPFLESYKCKYPKIKAVVAGGATRQESVKNATDLVSEECTILAIHDGARPLITTEDIDGIIEMAEKVGAVCPVTKVVDTVKSAVDGKITSTIDRSTTFLASTPQAFKKDVYIKALDASIELNSFTDDCSMVEKIGQTVYTYSLTKDNRKLTVPEDFEEIKMKLTGNNFRVGHGYDVHKLVENRALILGGVNIPYEKGLLGHSDADVLVHAIMDAMLGAAGLKDIGYHFPDSAEEYKGISSIELLKAVKVKLQEKGFVLSNVDATVIAQRPKLAPYIDEMTKRVADALGVDPSDVNIKATTEEHLGFTGEGLGISAHAVCLIR